MRRSARRRVSALALSVALLPAAARAADAPALRVVASIHPLALLAREVGGERAAVEFLVPPGASPHTFEPAPADLVRLAGARVYLWVGPSLDGWSLELLAGAERAPETLALLDVPGLEILRHGEHGEAGDGRDPHVWLDPVRVRTHLAPALSRLFARIDPDGAPYYAERLAVFQTELEQLDAEIRARLAPHAGCGFIAFHAAWRYFAARYGLREIAVVERHAGAEPTAREIAGLVRAAREARLRAILVEPQFDPRVAQTIAREFGGTLVRVDPNGTPDDPERARYAGLLRFDARAFETACGGAS